jgi:Mn2+/Fe2+ NRAMP family transporter
MGGKASHWAGKFGSAGANRALKLALLGSGTSISALIQAVSASMMQTAIEKRRRARLRRCCAASLSAGDA